MTLREARFYKRFSQWDLQIRTGLHQSKISLIERGYVEPSPEERKRIAEALDINPDELSFNGQERKP